MAGPLKDGGAGSKLSLRASFRLNRRTAEADKADMRALSIRQPHAELILRRTSGQQIKPIKFRSRPTRVNTPKPF